MTATFASSLLSSGRSIVRIRTGMSWRMYALSFVNSDITAAAGTIWTAVEKRVALYGLASRPLGTVARSALAAAVASSTFWTGLAAVATGVALYCVYTAMSVPVSSAIALFSKSLGDGDLRIGRLTQGQLHVALDRAEATR